MPESSIDGSQKRPPSLTERFKAIGFSDVSMLVAQGAARLGGRQLLKYSGASPDELQVKLKSEAGMTPVTIADLESEAIITRLVTGKLFPDHLIDAEESGQSGADRNFVWYIDPLDGTRSFTRQQDTSTVGLAHYEKGRPKQAAVCRPFQKELLVAEAGKGAFVFQLDDNLSICGDPVKIEVSDREALEGGIIYIDGVMTEKSGPPTLKFMGELLNHGKFDIRVPGTNIGQQCEVAMGHGELTLTTAVGGFYDIAAGSLLIKEAGGEFIGIDGKPVTSETQVALGGNKALVAQMLPLLKECYSGYQGFK